MLCTIVCHRTSLPAYDRSAMTSSLGELGEYRRRDPFHRSGGGIFGEKRPFSRHNGGVFLGKKLFRASRGTVIRIEKIDLRTWQIGLAPSEFQVGEEDCDRGGGTTRRAIRKIGASVPLLAERGARLAPEPVPAGSDGNSTSES